ncbi:MAG: AI-2E family transporter YdiK, partial [Luteimonas sp.]
MEPKLKAFQQDLTRIVLAVLSILLLIVAALWVLKPFALAIVWATMIVVATWPLMIAVQRRLANKRFLAVLVMCVVLVLFLVVPLAIAIATIVGSIDQIPTWLHTLASLQLPPPPAWIAGIPFVGESIASTWRDVSLAGTDALFARLSPYGSAIAKWVVSEAGNVGYMLIQFTATVAIAGVMYARGEDAAVGLRRFGYRLAGERGEAVIVQAGQAIRGVALGIGVTALIQTALAGVGLAVAGVPFAGILTAVILLLCLAQLGPTLVLAPAVIWLYWKDDMVWAVVLLVWTVIVGSMDNIIRPVLIRKGADLPLLVIFAGVIGGLLTFGIIGLFVGPVVLAVTYTLLRDWVNG